MLMDLNRCVFCNQCGEYMPLWMVGRSRFHRCAAKGALVPADVKYVVLFGTNSATTTG